MAKRIADTPALKGQEAIDFIIEMNKPLNDDDKELKQNLDNLKRFVPF